MPHNALKNVGTFCFPRQYLLLRKSEGKLQILIMKLFVTNQLFNIRIYVTFFLGYGIWINIHCGRISVLFIWIQLNHLETILFFNWTTPPVNFCPSESQHLLYNTICKKKFEPNIRPKNLRPTLQSI